MRTQLRWVESSLLEILPSPLSLSHKVVAVLRGAKFTALAENLVGRDIRSGKGNFNKLASFEAMLGSANPWSKCASGDCNS